MAYGNHIIQVANGFAENNCEVNIYYPRTYNKKSIDAGPEEYYGTTTFGSRVADGIYETILDGYEINQSPSKIKHFLFVDDKFTWWKLGKSYLCRMIDILNMGLVDEIFFGKEVTNEWPKTLESIKKEYF